MPHKHAAHTSKPSAPASYSILVGALFSITLAISLFAAGFAVCTLPGTTDVLSRLFSNFEASTLSPADTTAVATATRNFTVEPHATGDDAATTELATVILRAAQDAADAQSSKAPRWKGVAWPKENDTKIGAVQQMYALAAQGSQYAFGENEISHLQDCNNLIRVVVPVFIIIAIIALVSGIALGMKSGRKILGRGLVAAPALILLSLIGLGVWAALDFYSFFHAFHGLFFPQGNWTFPADSLLICTLPTPFWIGMVALWALTSISLCLFSVFIGRRLSRTSS